MDIVDETQAAPVRYVTYDEDGNLTGCYLQVPPEEHVGSMIVLDEAQAAEWVNLRANVDRSGVEPRPAPAPDPVAEMQRALDGYEAAVQCYMDTTAWLYGYDTLISAITYADEPAVPAFQTEGRAFRAWRSLVWAKCREVLAQYNAGERAAPTDDELVAELPALDLPAPTLGRTVQ